MLKGQTVNVRLFRESDLDELSELWQDVRARGPFYPLGLASPVSSRKEFSEFGYWRDGVGKMAIVDKEDLLLGQIGCFKPAPYLSALELYYIILRPLSRGHGYMSEAVQLFVAYLFDLHPFDRLQLTAALDNQGSIRVAEKCGFRREGVMRRAWYSRGQYRDMALYSLIREEWQVDG